jgi:hypothetical protein
MLTGLQRKAVCDGEVKNSNTHIVNGTPDVQPVVRKIVTYRDMTRLQHPFLTTWEADGDTKYIFKILIGKSHGKKSPGRLRCIEE